MAPLLAHTPSVLLFAAILGATTALLGAAIALLQNDLKRVLAYSTVSQLGYMFLAMGCGAADGLMGAAVVAAMFHLFTHAFFKALLFLSAGNVMHAMGDVIDMRRFSGLRRVLPRTNVAFLIGVIALAGVPPLAGFWSKDAILALVGQAGSAGSWLFYCLLLVGLVTALLTSVYSFLAYLRTFHGPEQFPSEAGDHPHEAATGMLVPIAVLSVGAILAGLLGPIGWMEEYLQPVTLTEAHSHESVWIVALSVGAAVLGFAIALGLWRGLDVGGVFGALGEKLGVAAANRFYLDEIYGSLVVGPLRAVATGMAWLDQIVVQGIVAVVATIPRVFGLGFQQWQTGMVQSYALAMAVGLAVIVYLTIR
jgi:NADH-quinone oxidoreductase subunit L